jgi:hypothetical protein
MNAYFLPSRREEVGGGGGGLARANPLRRLPDPPVRTFAERLIGIRIAFLARALSQLPQISNINARGSSLLTRQ